MPCGGIWPYDGQDNYECFYCNKKDADHWLEEWDSFIHYQCVAPFLATEEGKVVLEHEHEIYMVAKVNRPRV